MNYRNEKLLRLAKDAPCMLKLPGCTGGGEDSVPAHSNQLIHGKGTSIKSHDMFFVAACSHCHKEIDQGFTMNKAMKFDAWNTAYFRWQEYLWKQGLVKVAA